MINQLLYGKYGIIKTTQNKSLKKIKREWSHLDSKRISCESNSRYSISYKINKKEKNFLFLIIFYLFIAPDEILLWANKITIHGKKASDFFLFFVNWYISIVSLF